MKVLFCSSEVVPFAKTGGLADVAGTLPPALEKLGVEVKVIMPRYRNIDVKKFNLKKLNDDIYTGKLGENIEVFFIENKRYFDRDGLYQDNGMDYPDNLDRFTYYCVQTLKLMKKIKFKPDVIHCNDWQSALIPVYLKTIYSRDAFYKKTKTVFTIHNLGYQGLFPAEQLMITGLDKSLFHIDGLEFYGRINLLKAGLVFSDKITTVSPTYSREIQSGEFGCGLEGVLLKRRKDITGILNGIDYAEWDPQTNKALKKNFSAKTIEDKYVNKEELQELGKMKVDRNIPILGIVTRLADQKGLDILSKVMNQVIAMPIQFVLLGTGDPRYHVFFESIGAKHKNTFITLKFDASLAYKIYASSDIFLMPSYYEPCGLGQLISLNFATIPLVRSTGGLADTVQDYDPFTGNGNGFVFDRYEPSGLLEAIKRALVVYNHRGSWRKLMLQAMQSQFPWEKSAKEYLTLYKDIKKNK